MSKIPVFVLGIKRKSGRAQQTARHLKKVGFSNVKIFWGLDLKRSNPDKIKHNEVVLYNNQLLMERNPNLEEVIISEDDTRITEPTRLMKHLKGGIKGIDRLVWNKIYREKKGRVVQGAQMIGYNRSGMNRLLDMPLSAGHIDLAISKRLNEKVSGPFGIEYIYGDLKKNRRGKIIGMNEKHTKSSAIEETSQKYDAGENIPLSHKRYE